MIPAWLVIGITAVLIGVVINRLIPIDQRWFFRLRRPAWLTFEWAIPLIWITIFICLAWSAYIIWQTRPGTITTAWLLAGYVGLEIVTLLYTPVMCFFRRLRIGALIGATGFFMTLALSIPVSNIAPSAFLLLLPYLLWSPIGTLVTWQMMALNNEF